MKKITCLFSFILLAVLSYAQGHFVPAFIGSGQNQMNIYVVTATIEGVDLETDDEIAVFDGTICCGRIILTQSILLTDYRTFAAIVASEKETGLENGFTSGNAITYKIWDSSKNKELSGISAEYFDNSTPPLPTTAPNYTPDGSAFVKLTVAAPIANAGSDQLVNENSIFTLDGSASSDPDNQIMTYLWTAPDGITLSSTTSVNPTFTAPEVITNTKYTFSLIVNDGDFDSPIDQVEITVKQVNKAPIANAGADQSVNEGATITLDGTASTDPDNDVLTYLWTAPDGVTLSSATAAKPTFTAPEVMTNSDYTFTLVVNDGTLNSTADQVVVQVKQVNKAPVANAGADQSVNEGVVVTLDGTASTDPDNDVLTYLWTAPDGITLSSATAAKPTFTAPEVSSDTNYTLSLVVNDGTLNSTAVQVIIQVKQVNKAPVANAGADQSVNEGVVVTLDGTASTDPDNDVLTYLWTAPDGITLSSATAANPTFTAPEVSSDTNYTLSLVVSDESLTSTADLVVVTVKQVNKVPIANAGADQSVNEGATITLDGSASSDPDNNTLTYLWTAPAGITLSSATDAKPTFTAPEVMTDSDFTFSLIVNDGTLNSTADQVDIQVKQVNKAPIANAGADQSVNEGATVTLDGSASTDPDNDVLTYLWTAPAGVTLSSATAAKPTFTAPEVMTDSDYTFSLVVSDGTLNSTADQVVIQVKQVNKVPVANAGIDQSVNEGSTVTLDGTTSTDPDNDVLTYLWTAPAGITLSSLTAAKPTLTAPEVMTNTDFTFSLVVNDGTLNSTADQIIVQVMQVNKVPVANAGADQSVNEGVVVTLDGTVSADPDNDALTYLWTAPAGIALSSATAAKPTFTAPEVSSDTNYTLSLVVNDGTLNSIADQVVITVKQVNKAPVANADTDQSVNEGATITLDGTASTDPDNDVLTYLWTAPDGITLSSATTANPTFTAPEVMTDSDYTFSLIVNDGTLNSIADQVDIQVKQVNKVPVANAGADQSVNEGVVVTLDGTASSDPDNDALTYLWTAPAGVILSSATAVKPTFTAPEVMTDSDYTFSLVVNDGTLTSTADLVVVTVKQVNKAPVANAGADQSVNEGVVVTLDGSASSDPDNNTLTYLWTAPDGITLSSATAAKPTFTAPEVSSDTNYTLSLVVNDGTLNSTADQVIIQVKQVNKAPIANAGADQSVNEGVVVTLDGTASTDPDNDALTYLWTAPAGVILSSATAAKPTFTAPEVMTDSDYTFSLVVNDGTLNSTADQVVIQVKQVNKAPIANAGADQSVDEGATVTLDGTASSDPDNDILTYLWTAPAGITLSSATAAKPTFTAPEVMTNTDYTFSLVVNDGTLNSTADQVVVQVKQVNKVPVANAGADQSVNEGVVVTLDGTASTDPDNNVLTYLWTAPDGIALSSATVAKPTFTAPEVSSDTNYTFSLVVNDGTLNSIADQVIIQVKQVNKAPIANAGADLSVNEGATVTLDGTASTDPDNNVLTYLWTAPDGITLSSATAAKPTFTAPEVMTDSDYTFSLVVNDGTLNSTADQVVIQVKQVNKAPVANAGADQSVNEGVVVTLDGTASTDPDNDILTYLWTAPAGVTLSSATTAKPTFTAPEVMANTDFTFSLVVNDGTLNSIADQVIIQVKQVNKVPIANAGADQSVNEGVVVTLDGTASTDPDNDVLTYLWTAPAGVTLSSATAAKPTFIAPEVMTVSDYTFSLVVNDGTLNSTADQVIVQVKQVNKVPIANAGADQSVNEGVVVTLDGTASTDPDNDVLTYLWTAPAGVTLSSATAAKPTFTAPEVMTDSDYTFSLVVNDGTLNSTADQVDIQIKQVNKVPVANAGADQSVNEGVVVTLDGTASSDPDNNALTYLWTAPAGITLSSATTANPTFTAPEASSDTNYTLSLVVNDGTLNSTADQVVIQVKQVNKAPVANAGADQSVDEGVVVTLDGTASTDPDNDVLTYLWTAPAGITLSSATAAKPTFTAPEVMTNTDYTFSLVVNDGTLNSTADQVVIQVKQVNKVPIANAGADQSVNEGVVVTLDGTASTDPDNDVLTYLWTASDGITLSSATAAKPTFTAPEITSDTDFTFSLVVNDGTVDSPADQVIIQVKNLSSLQEISLNIGWNLISANVIPANLNLKDLFQTLIDAGKLKKVMDETGKTIENFGAFGGWKNNIGNLNSAKGYKVNVTEASTLSLEGTPVPLPFDIALAAGWNIISYPSATAQDAKALVQSLIDAGKLKKVMDETGKTIENFGAFGGWKNNIGNFMSGKGYKVNVTENCILTIPSEGIKSANIAPEVLTSSHFKTVFKGNGTDHMNIHLVNLQASGLNTGDEIGVFEGKLCVGSATVGAEQMMVGTISIPASANDEMEETVNGFSIGHAVDLQLYRGGQTYQLNIEKLSGSESFEKNGSLFAKALFDQTTRKDELTDITSVKCYPNPFTDQIIMEIQLQEGKELEVTIYDVNGKLVRNLYKGMTEKGTMLVWDGRNESGVKVVTGSYYAKINQIIEKLLLK